METPKHKLEIVPEENITPELDAGIRALLCECFPPDVPIFRQNRCWHDCAPEYTLVYRREGKVLGHVGVMRRTITCGGVPVDIAGIESLAVSPTMRGTGLSRELMNESMAEAKRRGIPFGFLFCSPQLAKFYASLGWRTTHAAVTMHDENGLDVPQSDKSAAMFLNLTPQTFPEGDIHLQGRDW
ncbi:MAG: GNAT family N-acetyltransferase [Phycisphaerae bacterium]|nr:GNAT family N-acetyltransferase [Phycisphaerae bacterium]